MEQAYNNTIFGTVMLLAYKEGDETLYRTQKGEYFKVQEATSGTSGRIEAAKIILLSPHDAAAEYNRLTVRQVGFKEGFPDIDVAESQYKKENGGKKRPTRVQ